MSTSTDTKPRISEAFVSGDCITARLEDGRSVSIPLHWSWRLAEATPAQRQHLEIIGNGVGIHWPDVDEDLSVEGMLAGIVPPPKHTHPSDRSSG